MDQLTESFRNLKIVDNRMEKRNESFDEIMVNMFSKLNISNNDDFNELIKKMGSMTLNDDNIVVKMKNNTVIVFYFNGCKNEYNLMANSFIPKWGDAY